MKKLLILVVTLATIMSCGAMASPFWQDSSVSLGVGNSTILSVIWNSTSPLSAVILSTNETGVWKNYTKPVEYMEGMVPILYYHNIDDADTSEYTTKVKNFTAQMNYLYRNNYNTITFAELVEHMSSDKNLPEKSVVITFDDGWKGNYENAFPVLKRYGFIATFFIITETALDIGNFPDYMSVADIQALHAAGMEIACHSKTHPVGGLLNATADLNIEINQSRQDIYNMTGVYPKTFAYPEGVYNKKIIDWVKQNGFIGAREIEKDGVEEGWIDPRFPWIRASENETDRYIVNSNSINSTTTLSGSQASFEAIVNYTKNNEFEDIYETVSDIGAGNISVIELYNMDSFSTLYLPDAGDSVSAVVFIPSEDNYNITFRIMTGSWNTTNMSSYNPENNSYSYYVDGLKYNASSVQKYVNDTYADSELGFVWGSHAINNLHMAAGFHIINVSVSFNAEWNGLDYFTITYSNKIINASNYYNSPRFPRTHEAQTNFTWKNSSVPQNTIIGWRIYANDTSGNWNVTNIFSFKPGFFKPPFWTNLLSQLVITYSLNNHSNFSIRWNNGSYPIRNVYIEHNFTGGVMTTTPMNGSYPNYYFNTTILNAGTYQYRFVADDIYGSQNSTQYMTLNISKAPTNATMYLNGSTSSQKSVYPNNTMNITAVSSVPGLLVELRMNSELVANSANVSKAVIESWAQNNTFTAAVLGNENYQSSQVTRTWNISKGKSDVKAYINGEPSNQTVTYPTLVNVSGNSTTLINPPVFNVYINSLNQSGNPASMADIFNAGVYDVIYSTWGNENWTSENDTLWLTVLQNETNAIILTINNVTSYDNQDVNITYGTPLTVNCSVSYPELGPCYLYRVDPDSNVTYIGNNETITLGVGYYTYTAVVNESHNYTGSWVNCHVIVSRAVPVLNLNINGQAHTDTTVIYGTNTSVVAYEENEGDSDCVYTLFRDGGLLNSSYGNASNISIVESLNLGTYTYTYSLDADCQNWTYGYETGNLGVIDYVPPPVLPQFIGGGGGGVYVSSISSPIVRLARGNASVTMSFMASGGKITARIAKYEDIAIRAMNVTVLNNVSNVMIIITKMPMLSPTLYEEGGDVYNYISMDMINITNDDIGDIWLRFAVNKNWLLGNGIDASNVTLYRWYEKSWADLNAVRTGEDSNEVFYTVDSPGFSTFAIGTKMVMAQAPAPAACVEKWSCTKWSKCKDGYQVRSCTDESMCGSQFKPWEFKECYIISDDAELSPLSGLMNLGMETKTGLVIVLVSLVLATIFFRKSRKYNTKSIGILKPDSKVL